MKCEICKKEIKETFLKKPMGTYVKDRNGKRRLICSSCQSLFRTKEAILEKLS